MNRNLLVLNILIVSFFTCSVAANSFATPVNIEVGDKIMITGLNPAATIPAGRGGPYRAYSPDGSWENFLTFCLEVDEYLNFSSTFLVGDITKAADNGGKNTSSGDPLSAFTAYIYTKAVNGDYDANLLDDVQYSIWFEEEEIEWNSLPCDARQFYDKEKISYDSSGWSGLGNVRVINLTDLSGSKRQDLIVSVPESPAAATLIMGIGLIGFASFYGNRTRFKRI